MPTTSSTTSAARWSPPAGRWSICSRKTRKSPSTSTATRWQNCAIRQTISVRPAPWSIGYWPCALPETEKHAQPAKFAHQVPARDPVTGAPALWTGIIAQRPAEPARQRSDRDFDAAAVTADRRRQPFRRQDTDRRRMAAPFAEFRDLQDIGAAVFLSVSAAVIDGSRRAGLAVLPHSRAQAGERRRDRHLLCRHDRS